MLRHALGAGTVIKYGVGAGPLGKLTADSKELLGVSAFNSAYSDSGLFGVVMSTTPNNAKAVSFPDIINTTIPIINTISISYVHCLIYN